MTTEPKKTRRAALFKDLVELHQSIAGEPADPVARESADDGAPDSHFTLFVENFPMGVLFAQVIRDRYRHPIEFRVCGVNRRYAELLGLARVSVLESPFFDVVPGGRADWATELETVALKGRPVQGIAKPVLGDRSLRVLFFMPRRDMLAVVLDEADVSGIGLRGSAQENVRQTDDLLATSPLLICRFRPGGELVYANDAYQRFFGVPRESLTGHCYMPCVPPSHVDFVRSRIELICRDNPAVTYEAPFDLAGGRCWVQWTDSGVFDQGGKLMAYQSAGLEVTALKQTLLEAERQAGLLRDLLALQSRRNREKEGSYAEVSQEQRTLAEDNQLLKREVKRLEALTLKGKMLVCRRCFRIHDEEGHWMLPPLFLELHTSAAVGSGICPYCQPKSKKELVRETKEE